MTLILRFNDIKYAVLLRSWWKGWIDRLKNVQISEKLFFVLLKYHLLETDDVLPEIKKGLEEKLEAMVKRDLYLQNTASMR